VGGMGRPVITFLRWMFAFGYAILFAIVMGLMIDRGGWWILAGIGLILLTLAIGTRQVRTGSSGVRLSPADSATATSTPTDNSAIWVPPIFTAIGVYSALNPDAVLDGRSFDKLRDKQSFALALGVICVGFAVGSHAGSYWGCRGFARVSWWGRLIGGWSAVLGFVYIFSSIVEVAGWPWG
jgi:hypothetical protein